MSQGSSPPRRLRSAGWVLALALGLTAAAAGWRTMHLVRHRPSAKGDGQHPESYGFPLTPAAIPVHEIVASGIGRDGLPVLVNPPAVEPAELASFRRFLLPSDLVVGVRRGGQARAYPLRALVWHEVVNDTLGGEAIAVAHAPLAATTVVFSRRLGGRTATFGISGLLHNCGHLLHDGAGSLWSPILLRAVTGPAVARGERLQPLPVVVAPWAAWLAANPHTTVLAPDPALLREYRRDPYASYFGSDLLRFPVSPLPADRTLPLKAPVLAVQSGDAWCAFPIETLRASADPGGRWRTTVAGVPLQIQVSARPLAAWVTSEGSDLPTIYAARFAWYAAYGSSSIAAPEQPEAAPALR